MEHTHTLRVCTYCTLVNAGFSSAELGESRNTDAHEWDMDIGDIETFDDCDTCGARRASVYRVHATLRD